MRATGTMACGWPQSCSFCLRDGPFLPGTICLSCFPFLCSSSAIVYWLCVCLWDRGADTFSLLLLFTDFWTKRSRICNPWNYHKILDFLLNIMIAIMEPCPLEGREWALSVAALCLHFPATKWQSSSLHLSQPLLLSTEGEVRWCVLLFTHLLTKMSYPQSGTQGALPKESHLHPDQTEIMESWLSGLILMLWPDENLGVQGSLNTGANRVGTRGECKELITTARTEGATCWLRVLSLLPEPGAGALPPTFGGSDAEWLASPIRKTTSLWLCLHLWRHWFWVNPDVVWKAGRIVLGRPQEHPGLQLRLSQLVSSPSEEEAAISDVSLS